MGDLWLGRRKEVTELIKAFAGGNGGASTEAWVPPTPRSLAKVSLSVDPGMGVAPGSLMFVSGALLTSDTGTHGCRACPAGLSLSSRHSYVQVGKTKLYPSDLGSVMG